MNFRAVNLHQLAAVVAVSSVAGCFTGLFSLRSVLKKQALGTLERSTSYGIVTPITLQFILSGK